jgi:hypothetical protein
LPFANRLFAPCFDIINHICLTTYLKILVLLKWKHLIILKYENKACTQKFYDGGSLSVYNTTLKRCCHFFLQYKCCSMKCFHFNFWVQALFSYFKIIRAVVIVIIWYLDLQLPMQSVPITINVVSLNPAQESCTPCNIMW